MLKRIRDELDRMAAIVRVHGFELQLSLPAASETIAAAETVTGIKFDDGMRALYSLTNGLPNRCLAVQTDELTVWHQSRKP